MHACIDTSQKVVIDNMQIYLETYLLFLMWYIIKLHLLVYLFTFLVHTTKDLLCYKWVTTDIVKNILLLITSKSQ